MNILYVVSGTNLAGGATKSLLTLLRGVSLSGHRALVVCPDCNELFERLNSEIFPNVSATALGYTYDILPFRNNAIDYLMFLPRLVKRFIRNRLAARKLKRIATDFHADIIHTNTSVNNIGYLAAKSCHMPHIWHIREYGKKDFGMIVPFQRKKLTAPGNYTICITKDIQRAKCLEYDRNSIVIYNGIIDKRAVVYEDARDYFLYAGRITAKKGVLDLIDAYVKVAKSTQGNIPDLWLAGRADNEIESRIKSISATVPVNCNIKLLGEMSDVSEVMQHSKAVIVPSYSEGFGRILPEAMSNGALTIGRDTAGTKEQFDNGLELTGQEIGLRFSTVEELSSILAEVSDSSKNDFEDMIRRSQKVVMDLYGEDSYVEKVIGLYEKILEQKGGEE